MDVHYFLFMYFLLIFLGGCCLIGGNNDQKYRAIKALIDGRRNRTIISTIVQKNDHRHIKNTLISQMEETPSLADGPSKSFQQYNYSTSSRRQGVIIMVGTGKIGDEVRVCLRSLAVNVPGSNVVLIADDKVWKHLQHEVRSNNIQALNLLVMNYDAMVATSLKKFYEVASARYYCIYMVLHMILNAKSESLTHSEFAWHNITNRNRGIPKDVAVTLICDIRDVVFQRDPFQQFWFEADKRKAEYDLQGMMVLSQEWPRPVRKCSVNKNWVDVCFGLHISPILGNVHCSGSFMASTPLMYEFLKLAMLPILKLCKAPMHGFDQGVFNVIIHFPEYSMDRIARNRFLSNKLTRMVYHIAGQFYGMHKPIQISSTVTSGWITTMGAGYYNDTLQRLMIRNGTDVERPCALCHQYDRENSWTRRFKRLYNEPLNLSSPICDWLHDPYKLGDSCLFSPRQHPELYAIVQEIL
jgi:hypothetical protein